MAAEAGADQKEQGGERGFAVLLRRRCFPSSSIFLACFALYTRSLFPWPVESVQLTHVFRHLLVLMNALSCASTQQALNIAGQLRELDDFEGYHRQLMRARGSPLHGGKHYQ